MIPPGFANPLGRNPFAAPQDVWGHPRVSLTERELEAAMRAYCRVWDIPVPASTKARAKPEVVVKRKSLRGVRDTALQGQTHLFR